MHEAPQLSFDPPDARRPSNLSVELRGVLEAASRFVSTNEPIPESVLGLRARAALIARKFELNEAMRPGDKSEISQSLLTFVDMRGGFKPGSAAEAAYFNKLRAADLSEVPLWALVETVKAFRRAEIGAGLLRPTAGQLRKHSFERAAALFVELRDIERVLAAPVISTPTEDGLARRKVLARRLHELGSTLGIADSDDRKKARKKGGK